MTIYRPLLKEVLLAGSQGPATFPSSHWEGCLVQTKIQMHIELFVHSHVSFMLTLPKTPPWITGLPEEAVVLKGRPCV